MAKKKMKTGKPLEIGKKPGGMKKPAGGGTKMVGKGAKGKKGKGDCPDM